MKITPFALALQLYKANFYRLIIVVTIVYIPMEIAQYAYNYFYTDGKVLSAAQAMTKLFILMSFIPFMHAGASYVLLKSKQQESYSLVYPILTGLHYWHKLILANFLRWIFIFISIYLIDTYITPGRTDPALQSIFGFLLLLLVFYIIVRTGFFDFYIIFKQQSPLMSIKSSVRSTKSITAIMISIVAPFSMVMILLLLAIVTSMKDNFVASVVQYFVLLVWFTYLQTLLFTFYWLRNPPSKLESEP